MPTSRSALPRPSVVSPTVRGVLVHAAIVLERYVDLIETGQKTVESRLSVHRAVPFARVETGDVVLIKQRGGPYRLIVRVGEVWSYELLTRAGLKHLRESFGPRIAATHDYWASKRHARFATLIELLEPRAVNHGPELGGRARSGWVTLGPLSDPSVARFAPLAAAGHTAKPVRRRASA
ncbi:MAG: hypothetical protein IBJ18_01280 [Phycisphaerales bacterium]|nr:hypothetical protein [Phycisphaerales bacterium]